jgi:hypothetical protein
VVLNHGCFAPRDETVFNLKQTLVLSLGKKNAQWDWTRNKTNLEVTTAGFTDHETASKTNDRLGVPVYSIAEF